jgi:hypothetical protein
MSSLYSAVGILAMVLIPVGFFANLAYDLAHPERWSDWQHDPRIYGTLALVVMPPLLLILIREMWKLRRAQKRLNSTREVNDENVG